MLRGDSGQCRLVRARGEVTRFADGSSTYARIGAFIHHGTVVTIANTQGGSPLRPCRNAAAGCGLRIAMPVSATDHPIQAAGQCSCVAWTHQFHTRTYELEPRPDQSIYIAALARDNRDPRGRWVPLLTLQHSMAAHGQPSNSCASAPASRGRWTDRDLSVLINAAAAGDGMLGSRGPP